MAWRLWQMFYFLSRCESWESWESLLLLQLGLGWNWELWGGEGSGDLRHWWKENLKTIALIRFVPSINDILLFSRLFAARSVSAFALLSQCPVPSAVSLLLLPAVPQHFIFFLPLFFFSFFFLSYFYFFFFFVLFYRFTYKASRTLRWLRALANILLAFWPPDGAPGSVWLVSVSGHGPRSGPDSGSGSVGVSATELPFVFSPCTDRHTDTRTHGHRAVGCDYNWIRFDGIGFIVTSFCNYPC